MIWALDRVLGDGESEIARLAGRQRGLVTRTQLLAAGLTRHQIDHRLESGRLHARYAGVYAVGRPALEPGGEEMAALLYLGGHAVLSHASALATWGVAGRPAEIELTVVGVDRHSRPGLRLHRTAKLDRRDIRRHDGLWSTAPARSLLDFAGRASAEQLEEALAQARVRRLVTDPELTGAIERAPRRAGVGRLRALLDTPEGQETTRSQAERRLLRLLHEAQLPRPEVNRRRGGLELDLRWPDQRLVVEVDGWRYHGHRGAFEADRRRDQVLVASGYRVMRVTWWQLVHEPFAVVARIAAALGGSLAA